MLAVILVMLVLATPPSIPEANIDTGEDDTLPPDYDDVPPGMRQGPFNLTNDYDLIWEPNNIRGSTHAVATSPNKDLVAIAGGYLSDSEVHIYRWIPTVRRYFHVWDSGDGVIGGDVLDVAFMDADNNGRLEVVAGCADGRLYVFEAMAEESSSWIPGADNNRFELVWTSGDTIDRQIWSIVATDIDHDSQGEIIAGAWDSKVYLFDYIDHSAYPYCSRHWMDFQLVWDSGDAIGGRVNSVAVGDTDNDTRSEILAGSQDSKLYIFEQIPCFKHAYVLRWTSGTTIYRPINSIAVSNKLDSDNYGEIVVAAYGQGVFLYEYDYTTQDYYVRKFNRGLDAWETGVVGTTGVYTGYEADYYIDKKVYGWEQQGIFEWDTIPYPWNVTEIGGDSALGGPPDAAVTTFDSEEWYSVAGIWNISDLVGGAPYDVDFDRFGNVYVIDIFGRQIVKLSPTGSLLTAWGSPGGGPGQFLIPTSLTIDTLGNVYVADYDNDRVQKFTSEGDLLAIWGTSGTAPGQFDGPFGIVVSPDGRLYVSEGINSRIQVLDARNGGFITMWGGNGSGPGQFFGVASLALDSKGNVYAVDSGNDRVQKFTSEGNFMTEWGGYGSDEGEFYEPAGIAVDIDDQVYVTEMGNDRVQKFSSMGGVYAGFGHDGSLPGRFLDPAGIAVRSDGIVFVADLQNYRVQLFGLPEFRLLEVIGEPGSGAGQFSSPRDIDFGPDGYVYVTDQDNERVQVFAPDGTFIRQWNVSVTLGVNLTPGGIAVDEEGYVYVTDLTEYQVVKFTSNGTFVRAWGGAGSEEGQFSNPLDLTYSKGYIYVSDTFNNRIQVFTTEGAFVRAFGEYGSGPGQLAWPYGIKIAPNGLLYVADVLNGRVQMFDIHGAAVANWSAIYDMPTGLAIDSSGSVYVGFAMQESVVKFTDEGVYTAELLNEVGSYSTPITMGLAAGLAVDLDGSLYCAMFNDGTVLRFGFFYAFNNVAEAVVDFGLYEEAGGDATSAIDLYLFLPGTQNSKAANLEFAISQDAESFVPILPGSYLSIHFPTWPLYGATDVVVVDVDQALRDAQWEKYRYLKIGVKHGAMYEIDCALTRLARPIDTALVVTTGHINTTDPGDEIEEVIIGTSDGQLIACNSLGFIVWQSGSDTPRFSLDSGIRDIVQLDGRGRMPTWHFNETLVTSSYLTGIFPTFQRIESYCLVDVDSTSALDMVMTIRTSGGSRLIYLRNTGTDAAPAFTHVSGYFGASHMNPQLDSVSGIDYMAVTAADLDGDGDDDMVITDYEFVDPGYDFRIMYYEQTSTDYWEEVSGQMAGVDTVVESGAFTPRVSFCDMDGDNDLDMTLASDALYYFRQDGYGSTLVWTYVGSFYEDINDAMRSTEVTDKVAFHDFDRDGDWDLTLAHAYDNYSADGAKPTACRITYFENTGGLVYPVWEKHRAMYDPDFKGSALTTDRGYSGPEMKLMSDDDLLDLIVMQDDQVDMYRGVLSHDSFIVATYPYIHMIEVEKRGSDDGYYGYEAYDSWDNSVVFDGWTQAIEFRDTDHDGLAEVIVGSFDQNIVSFELVANNTYRRNWRSEDLITDFHFGTVDLYYWDDVTDLVTGDQDRDGKREIIATAGAQIRMFENVANDTYEPVWATGPISIIGGIPTHGALGNLLYLSCVTVDKDLDNDEASEIIAAGENYLLVYELAQNGSYYLAYYTNFTAMETGSAVISAIHTGDIDRDDFRDIVIVGSDETRTKDGELLSSTGWVRVFENEKDFEGRHENNSYLPAFEYTFQGAAYCLEVADNDGNGYTEFFVGTSRGLNIFEAVSDDDYQVLMYTESRTQFNTLIAGNSDGDSYREIIAGIVDGSDKLDKVVVLEMNQSYAPSQHMYDVVWSSSGLPDEVTDVTVGDSDGDKLLELLFTAAGGYVYSYEWVQNVTAPEEAMLASYLSASDIASDADGFARGGAAIVLFLVERNRLCGRSWSVYGKEV